MTVATKYDDWEFSEDRTAALHASGLSVALEKKKGAKGARPAVDIRGLERLAGTEWARKIDVLVREGLNLVEGERA